MKVEACFYLGYIAKAIGTKGELAFKLDVDSPSSYSKMDTVWVQLHPKDEDLVPFFPIKTELQPKGTLRISLEGIEDQAGSKNLVGKSLFLPLTELPALSGDQFYFHEIIGFEVEDAEYGKIGTVNKVLEYSTSNVLAVMQGEKEILIPISDETIDGLDREQKIVKVRCPEGLIDLYLES